MCASHRLGLCVMVLAQASVDACNDPVDHLQGSGESIACVFHLSVLTGLAKWINDVNCDSVMIISMNLLGLAGCQPLVVYPSPPSEPYWVMISVHGFFVGIG